MRDARFIGATPKRPDSLLQSQRNTSPSTPHSPVTSSFSPHFLFHFSRIPTLLSLAPLQLFVPYCSSAAVDKIFDESHTRGPVVHEYSKPCSLSRSHADTKPLAAVAKCRYTPRATARYTRHRIIASTVQQYPPPRAMFLFQQSAGLFIHSAPPPRFTPHRTADVNYSQ